MDNHTHDYTNSENSSSEEEVLDPIGLEDREAEFHIGPYTDEAQAEEVDHQATGDIEMSDMHHRKHKHQGWRTRTDTHPQPSLGAVGYTRSNEVFIDAPKLSPTPNT